MRTDSALEALRRWFVTCDVPDGNEQQRREDVEQLEQRTGLTLPHEFREYLLTLSPGAENYDNEETNWWPVNRIKTIAEELSDPIYQIYDTKVAARRDQYLVFADFSIWAWAWAIACTEDADRGRIFVIMGSETGDKFVAEGFDAFIKLYLRNPLSLC